MSTSSTDSTKSLKMHHNLLPKINIQTESTTNFLKSNAVIIFPESNMCEEPMTLEDETLFSLMPSCPSPIERKLDRYRKLRAMHERAGRLHKQSEDTSN